MAQETQIGALYQPRGVAWGGRWKGGSKGRGCIYTYGWLMLRFDRKEQNSVKQLSFNKKYISLKNTKKYGQKYLKIVTKWRQSSSMENAVHVFLPPKFHAMYVVHYDPF